jgi:hypothetical protein
LEHLDGRRLYPDGCELQHCLAQSVALVRTHSWLWHVRNDVSPTALDGLVENRGRGAAEDVSEAWISPRSPPTQDMQRGPACTIRGIHVSAVVGQHPRIVPMVR